jgi:hypothetical protein
VIALLLALAIPPRAHVTILESDARRVVVEIVPAPADVRPASSYVTIAIPGFGQPDEPGVPELPVRGIRVAVPPRTAPHLDVLSADWSGATVRCARCRSGSECASRSGRASSRR